MLGVARSFVILRTSMSFFSNQSPQQQSATKWIGGALIPLSMLIYAGQAVIAGHATFSSRRGFTRSTMEFHGLDVWLFAAALLGGAALAHFTLFWEESNTLAGYAPLGKGIAAVVLIVAVACLVARQFINFI